MSSTVDLPFSARSVRTARGQLTTQLLRHGAAPHLVDDAALVLSELLSNSLRHASARVDGTIGLSWRLHSSGQLDISVTDGGGTTRPDPRATASGMFSTTAHGGRGLGIVSMLVQDWGVRVAAEQQTVWAHLMVRAPSARRGRRPESGLSRTASGSQHGARLAV
jgi:anti-sigma regulatory factor (Ser/Thr protein kinase)